jgi:hypothetical protein
VGSKSQQAGPLTRQLTRLPMARATRAPHDRAKTVPQRENERNEE